MNVNKELLGGAQEVSEGRKVDGESVNITEYITYMYNYMMKSTKTVLKRRWRGKGD
jgi:hypothetical protein